MPYNFDDLRERSVEDVLNDVQALATVGSKSQIQSVGALGARLTVELADALHNLSGVVFTAKKQLLEHVDRLTNELQGTRQAMSAASDAASKQTAALVRWTKVLVFATIAYTAITGGLLLVAILQMR